MTDDKIRISPDALIAMVVTEAQDRELAKMPSIEEMNESFQTSEKVLQKMERLVRETQRKAERKHFFTQLKRFFIAIATALSIFSCTMLPVKAVREAVITTLIEWHDKFISVVFSNESSAYVASEFHVALSYIPSGFSPTELGGESSTHYYGQFHDSTGSWFSIRVLPIENAQQTSLDSEFTTYYSINFDGNHALWGIMGDASNTILWENGSYSFQVSGNLDLAELVKISAGILIE